MFGAEKVSFRRYTITRSLKTMSSMKDESKPGLSRKVVSLTSYSSAAMWCSGTVKSRVGGTVSTSISWTRGGGAGGVACSRPLNCSPRALTMVTFINESALLAQSPELARGGVTVKSTILRAMTLFFYVLKSDCQSNLSPNRTDLSVLPRTGPLVESL